MVVDRRRRCDDGFRRITYGLIADGYGRRTLACRLDVSRDAAKDLIVEYKVTGLKRLSMTGDTTYDYETKLAAVRDHFAHGPSKARTVFGIRHPLVGSAAEVVPVVSS